MKRIRQWIDRLSVKKKLVFYGYMTITPVRILICVALLFNNYSKTVSEKLNNDQAGVDTLAESLDILQTDIKDFSTYICINQDIQKLVTVDDPEEKSKNARLWLEETPMEMVQDMMALKGHIKTIAIYPENGLRPYLRCMDASAYIADLDTVRSTDIYKETLAGKNGMVWKNVPKGSGDTYRPNRSDKVVLYREMYDLTRKKALGYIVIGASADYFESLCENIRKSEKESVVILDKSGGILSQAGTLNEEFSTYLTGADFCGQNYREREAHFTFGDYEVIQNQLDKNAAIVCKIVPRYGLQMQILDIVYMPLLLLAGLLIGLLPLLLIMSNIVTRPLRRLSAAINEVSGGDFSQQVEVTTHDEVGEVAECFNRMVLAIKELIDENYVITLREKESELAALQAQMNPHFLYNTLDSLYWQATDAGNDEIAESILALSQLFRLVLSQGRREVLVSQEAELVSRYLQIQKMRFSRRLDYEVSIDPAIQRARIPKLILQPFVENAIVHGFENVSTLCRVTVTGTLENGKLRFEIRDTGIGMRQDQIDAIWEEEPDQYRKQRIRRYAIKNIRERLLRRYGEDFTLEIKSDVGKGTDVVLILPFEEERECH